jgi:hypothetical protein
MQAPMSDAGQLLDALARIAVAPAKRVFALMDGARFDDLPGMLAAAGLSYRSLYRNVQDAELVRAGPWLVDPYRNPDQSLNAWGGYPADGAMVGKDPVTADTEAALNAGDGEVSQEMRSQAAASTNPIQHLERIVSISENLPAAVFWIGDAGLTETNLWRHLRTLNMALIPKGYGEDEPQHVEEGDETHDALMFRHADGNVLAEVLPVLDAAQFSRIFGPANALLFLAPDHPASDGSILRRAILPNDCPPAPAGMLRLSMEQMTGIEEIRFERSQLRIARYLRDVAPEQAGRLSDSELSQSTARWMKEAQGHGVKSEASLGRWSYLQLASGGRFGSTPEVQRAMTSSDIDATPDEKVRYLLASVASNLRMAN